MPAVDAVVVHLRLSGYEVEGVCDTDYIDRETYKDRVGDIAFWKDGGARQTGEVKGRQFSFNSRESFPFDSLIVDRANKSVPNADFYFSVNKELTHAAVVSLASKDGWFRESIPDKKRGYSSIPVYKCPKRLAKFIMLKTEGPCAAPFEPKCTVCGSVANWGIDVFGSANSGRWYCNEHLGGG